MYVKYLNITSVIELNWILGNNIKHVDLIVGIL